MHWFRHNLQVVAFLSVLGLGAVAWAVVWVFPAHKHDIAVNTCIDGRNGYAVWKVCHNSLIGQAGGAVPLFNPRVPDATRQ